MVGFTRPHYPNDVTDEYKGKSGVGKYGDSVLELDIEQGNFIKNILLSTIDKKT